MLIQVEPCNIGNQIFRLMFAEHIRQRLPGSTVTGYRMPEFGLVSEGVGSDKLLRTGHKHQIDIDALLAERSQGYDGLLIDCYAQRLEYFEPQRAEMAAALSSSVAGHATRDDEIVINIRAGEILRGIHPDYMPLPISFYRRLVDETGLSPVFVGQVYDDPYSTALRKVFPRARFTKSAHWIEDFQTVRNATNIVVAVSSFSWLAAWLSSSAKAIHLPVAGFLNREQRPDVDLLPLNDSRYILHHFPVQKFTAAQDELDALIQA